MGKLTNLNPPAPITDSDIPPPIARDSEVTDAVNAHVGANHPHLQYLRPSEGDARYRQTAVAEVFTPGVKATALSQGSILATGNFAGYCGLEVRADPNSANSAAFMFLYRPGASYGVHFGLDSTNQLGVGGVSMGPYFYRIFHEGNPITARAPLPPATVAASSSGMGWNSTTGSAEFCDYSGSGSGDAFNFYRVPGNTSGTPTPSHRLSRIDTSGAYLQVSDKRLKSAFSPAPGLSTILDLSPLKYKHWECLGFDEKGKTLKLGEKFVTKIGFLAQEVEKVLPEAVASPFSEEDLHAVDYNCILACVVQAIKELHHKIVTLET